MAQWPNLTIIGVLVLPEVLYNHICEQSILSSRLRSVLPCRLRPPVLSDHICLAHWVVVIYRFYCIALKFDRQLGSSAAEASVTFQWSDNSKYKSRGFETLCEILQEDVLWSNIETYMVYRTIMGVIFHLFIICYDWWCHFPFFKKSFCHNQSGTKPNLVAKILATNFGVFFYIYVMFSKICSMWV